VGYCTLRVFVLRLNISTTCLGLLLSCFVSLCRAAIVLSCLYSSQHCLSEVCVGRDLEGVCRVRNFDSDFGRCLYKVFNL
jgi:hypothetical protein